MTIKKNHFLFKQALTAVMIVVVMVSCSGIFPTKISDIYANTQRYQDVEITIKGKVETSVSILGLSGFTVNDGTGTLFVAGGDKTPSTDSRVLVKGTISVPVKILDKSIIIFNATLIK